jgi:aspartate carbamoyltransferase catalytic subunit
MPTATLAATAPILLVNDLLTGAEWSPAQTRELLQLTGEIKAHPARYDRTLRGKFLALIFEKPSLRTRVTFEVGIQSMTSLVTSSAGCMASWRACMSSACWKKWLPARIFR